MTLLVFKFWVKMVCMASPNLASGINCAVSDFDPLKKKCPPGNALRLAMAAVHLVECQSQLEFNYDDKICEICSYINF